MKSFTAAGEGPVQIDFYNKLYRDALFQCYGEQFRLAKVDLTSSVQGQLPTWSPLRRLQYNRCVTNGVRPDGRPNGYDTDGDDEWSESQRAIKLNKLALDAERSLDVSIAAASTCIWDDKPESKILETSVAFTIRACFNQHFYDGNHRTAVLCLISDLLAAGYSLEIDPFEIYRILGSHSPAATWSEDEKDFTNSFSKASSVSKKLLAYLEKHAKRDRAPSPVSVYTLDPWASLVKDIPSRRVLWDLGQTHTSKVDTGI